MFRLAGEFPMERFGVAKQCLLKNTGVDNGFLLAVGLPELETELDLQKRTPQFRSQGPQFNENGR